MNLASSVRLFLIVIVCALEDKPTESVTGETFVMLISSPFSSLNVMSNDSDE